MKNKLQLIFQLEMAGENEERLILSGSIVFFMFSLVVGHFFFDRVVFGLNIDRDAIEKRIQAEKIYPVLVEQKYSPEAKRKQIRALSDVTAEGKGRLTTKRGFHTLSSHDKLELNRNAGGRAKSGRESKFYGEGDLNRDYTTGRRYDGSGNSGRGTFKIPSNYRFREDLRLNFGGSGRISIPRQKFPEYRYFKRMLRHIKQNFAPPGANYVSRDYFGYTVYRTIKPQIVKVLFLLDKEGNVRDIKVIPPVIQTSVADSCVMSIRGKNFGPPPKSVMARDGIIGLNFLFPPVH